MKPLPPGPSLVWPRHELGSHADNKLPTTFLKLAGQHNGPGLVSVSAPVGDFIIAPRVFSASGWRDDLHGELNPVSP